MTTTQTNQTAAFHTAKSAPVSTGHFLLGHMADFSTDVLGLYARLIRQYPHLVRVRLLQPNIFLLHDPELIREMLVKRATEFPREDVSRYILHKGLGNGILTSEGDFHRRRRKLMQPAFHHNRLQSYGRVMADYTQEAIRSWRDGETRNMHAEMLRLTMFITAKALFNADKETMAAQAETAARAIGANQQWLKKELQRRLKVPLWLPTRGNRAIKENNRRLQEMLWPIIEARYEDRQEDRGDLLSMLLTAEDDDGRGMNRRQVMDEVINLFTAGYETTSNALTWTVYLLSQNPAAEARLHAELDEVLNGRAPTLDDLPHLPYTEMVLKESMRLRPPLWSTLFRQTCENTTLGAYALPKGSLLTVPIYGIHRSPTYFPQPETFRPERFHPETGDDIPRYAYLPFGAGPHVCLGMQFAMMEAQLVLATVSQTYRLVLHPQQEVVPEPLLTLGPKYGMNMIVNRRNR